MLWKNIRFYLNPVTLLIEPIAYDEEAVFKTQYRGLIGSRKTVGSNLQPKSHFFDRIFNDIDYYKLYIKEIEKISDNKLLDNFFQTIYSDYIHALKILYKSYPYFNYKSKYPPLIWFWEDIDKTSYYI